ncbi:hypothetical protein [Gynuella sunshinyii]|uniref:Tfp pilus assembly protein PilF n=1 Tax=Gynuella sunshinyii YC6258 TaxID=1445510 RepID=A0A0C5W3Y0_9GAMM|nr:hypothetical protein [Gynuella sunshinyii]AJQ97324.1 hypothetical Protein YC6258_05294 [Gynuella sunshinyii YC6258]
MVNNQQLGSLLVARKLISQQQLEKALRVQKQNHEERLLGQILVELGLVNYSDLLRVANEELHIPRAEAALKIRARLKAQVKALSEPIEDTEPESTMDSEYAQPGKDFPEVDLVEIESLPGTRGDELQLIIMIQDMLVEDELHDSRIFIDDGLQSFPESKRLQWLQLWHRIKTHSWVHFINEYEELDAQDKQNQAFQILNAYQFLATGQFAKALPTLEALTGTGRKGKSYRLYLLGYCLMKLEQMSKANEVFYQYIQENKGSENRWMVTARGYLNSNR